jgi:hypothetical protein
LNLNITAPHLTHISYHYQHQTTQLPYISNPAAYHKALNSIQSDEEYARQLAAQEEQALNEKAALGLVQHDVANRERYEAKSPLSSVITTPEQLALALQKSKDAEGKDGQNKGPTARDFDTQFLANVDKAHHKGDAQLVAETSHVILFDIDNCGGEFEQIADTFVQSKLFFPLLPSSFSFFPSLLLFLFFFISFPLFQAVFLTICSAQNSSVCCWRTRITKHLECKVTNFCMYWPQFCCLGEIL